MALDVLQIVCVVMRVAKGEWKNTRNKAAPMRPKTMIYGCSSARLRRSAMPVTTLPISRNHRTELAMSVQSSQSLARRLTVENACWRNGT